MTLGEMGGTERAGLPLLERNRVDPMIADSTGLCGLLAGGIECAGGVRVTSWGQ